MVFMTASFLTFFTSLLLPFIRSVPLRKAYASSMGLLILFYCCGASNFFTIFQWLGAYIILRFVPAKPAMYLATFFGVLIAGGRTIYEFAHRDNPAGVKFILLLSCVKIHMLAVQNYDRDRILHGIGRG